MARIDQPHDGPAQRTVLQTVKFADGCSIAGEDDLLSSPCAHAIGDDHRSAVSGPAVGGQRLTDQQLDVFQAAVFDRRDRVAEDQGDLHDLPEGFVGLWRVKQKRIGLATEDKQIVDQ